MEKSQTKVDLLLKLIKYNKIKLEILNKMCNLELTNNITKEYNDLVGLYKQIYKMQHQLLYSINPSDKKELIDIIYSMNKSINEPLELSEILVQEDEYIVLCKTIGDLGIPFLQFFESTYNDQKQDEIVKFLSQLNNIIVHDYSNMCYHNIHQQIINSETTTEDKIKLIKLKYRWIFLSSDIEKRIMLCNFIEPKLPQLIDIEILKVNNLDLATYLDSINEIFSNIIINYINNICSGYIEINNINKLLLKTYADMITDFSLIDNGEFYIITENKEELEMINNQLNIIYSILKDANDKKTDYNKVRKYEII